MKYIVLQDWQFDIIKRNLTCDQQATAIIAYFHDGIAKNAKINNVLQQIDVDKPIVYTNIFDLKSDEHIFIYQERK